MGKLVFKVKRKPTAEESDEVEKPVSKKPLEDIQPRRDVHLDPDAQIRALGAAPAQAEPLDLAQPVDDSLEQELKTYIELRAKIEKQTEYKDKIKENLKAYLTKTGEVDDKGNRFRTLYIDGVRYMMMVEKRVSTPSLDRDKAIAMCREKGFGHCLDVIEVLKDDAFENVLKKGEITPAEVKSMIVTAPPTYAFKVFEDSGPKADETQE
jgi:hypothetical protein